MSDKVVVRGPSVGFAGLLTLLFIGLKLGGVITWSWLWVLAPLWLSFGFGVLVFLFLIIVAVLAGR